MTQPDKPSYQIYIAGASLAFGLPFLFIELISLVVGAEFFTNYPSVFGVAYVSLYVLGGTIGGALVARHVDLDKVMSAGVTTGLIAYGLQQVVSFVFFGSGVLGDTYPMFTLIGGSMFGSLLTRQNRKKAEKEEAEKAKQEEPVEEPEPEEEEA